MESMTPRYSSLSEIDKRLEILSLQREIYKESMKLSLNKAKRDLYPRSSELLGGFKGVVQKMVLTFAIKKMADVVRRFRIRERVEVLE